MEIQVLTLIFRYLFIIYVSLAKYCIYIPKINDAIPKRKDTTVIRFYIIGVTLITYVISPNTLKLGMLNSVKNKINDVRITMKFIS